MRAVMPGGTVPGSATTGCPVAASLQLDGDKHMFPAGLVCARQLLAGNEEGGYGRSMPPRQAVCS